jgi:pyruvate/2-oxoglutarate dehydrogenase complex dihydrolipoamide acyltransferase (E2) component
MPLANGQQVWYAFKYDGGDTAILVRMAVSPSNSATFSVWTPENVRQWAAGEKPNPVGRGVKNDQFGGDLIWAGSFKFPGTYYVLVEQIGRTAGSYKLDISGKGVSFPPPAAATTAAAVPAAKPAAAATTAAAAPATKPAAAEKAMPATAAKAVPATAVTKAGTGPDDALTPSGEWAPLAKGQQVWYALPQDGGGSKILARMAVEPKNSASFKILTPENVQLWAAGQKYEPVGRGASSDAFGGDQIWTGSFKTPGAYYIVVEQTGANEGGYKLSVQ